MLDKLAVVIRSDYIESLHMGIICVVDPAGRILYQRGSPDTRMFFRSSAKPFQAIPLIESGAAKAYGFTPQEIALACASHSGQPEHQNILRALLKRLDLNESQLKCGLAMPYNPDEANRLVMQGLKPSVLHCSCSGKHTAMLALSKYLGADTETYRDIKHPVQQEALKAISLFTDEAVDSIPLGIDGCGLPIYLLPIRKTALAYARLTQYANDSAKPFHQTCKTIFDAMYQHPDMVAGQGEFCTDLMQATHGKLIAKIGAEAVYCLGVKEGNLGICVKIADGNERAIPPVIINLLIELGVLSKDEASMLKSWHKPLLMNNLEEVTGSLVSVVGNEYGEIEIGMKYSE